ncbi:MAG TPA: hypothetical protein VK524_18700 [Polyangiaceae bacterium]|nr:hypothetical protein [Polyangiaceae bacterium]
MHARRLLTASALLLGACLGCARSSDDVGNPIIPVTASEIRQRTQGTVGNIANSVPDIAPLTQDQNWAALSGAVSAFLSTFDSVPLFPSQLGSPLDAARGCPDPSQPDEKCSFNPRAFLLDLGNFLEQQLFSDENLESSNRISATFLLRGAPLCQSLQPCSGATPEECPAPNAECVQNIDAAEIRLKAALAGAEGIDVELMVGPERAVPLKLELRRDAVALEIDMHNVKRAFDHLQGAASSGDVQLTLAEGALRLEVSSAGPNDISVLNSIPEAIQIGVNVPQGTLELRAGAKVPAFALRAQGSLGSLSIVADSPAIDLSVPYAFLTGDRGSGTLALHLGEQRWHTQVTAGEPSLVVRDIASSSPSTLTKDGVPIFSLDFNPNSGRKFDLSLSPVDTTGVLFSVKPELHVSAEFDLQVIAPEFPDIPSVFQNAKYEVALRGWGEASILPIASPGALWDRSLKVVTGELSLFATGAERLVVRAGNCVKSIDQPPEPAGFLVGVCP